MGISDCGILIRLFWPRRRRFSFRLFGSVQLIRRVRRRRLRNRERILRPFSFEVIEN
ncbi:hypothetical protein Pd630_LPD06839 [Rhodococcus opacus PD630]|nr:hypothetical protein Pd630_LPD06839 [Rhodococcus opacus PD630]